MTHGKTVTFPKNKKMGLEQPEAGKADPLKDYKSLNSTYKFMSLDSLQYFKKEYLKSVSTLILRMYKSIYAMYQLYPEANDFQTLSIFDKVYQL